jgi:hypothetical protein
MEKIKKMKTLKYLLIAFIGLTFLACEELNTFLDEETDKLTEQEVVEGLKTALLVGTDTAVSITSKTNGYYQDEVIKILLPQEVQEAESYIRNLGLGGQLDDFILSMNRAAEDAADEAGPIFSNAITDLSISDGWDILNGINPAEGGSKKSFDSTAATNYLRSTTYSSLYGAFQPKIKNSLDKKLIGDYSTNKIWNDITTTYNSAATLAGWDQIETELDVYVTEKGLDGLFIKVGKEEKAIRNDPWAWAETKVGNILERVFGDN